MNIRVILEELMLSFSFDCYTNEDLNLCQQIKDDSDNDKYYFANTADKEFFTHIVYPKFQEIKKNNENNHGNPWQNQQDSIHKNEHITIHNAHNNPPEKDICKSFIILQKPEKEPNKAVVISEEIKIIENYFVYDIRDKNSKINDTTQDEENINNKEGEQIKKNNSFSYLSESTTIGEFHLVDPDDLT